MQDEFVEQLIKVENEWVSRDPKDDNLKKELTNWLSVDHEHNLMNLHDDCNLEYFIRSYRAAYESIICNMQIKRDATKKDINSSIKSLIKHTLLIKIGNVEITITNNPSASHLGNGHIKGIGRYEDIWPVLNLITDGNPKNNSFLAKFFLKFSDGIFEFDESHLKSINPKFNTEELKSSVPYFCRYLTGLAFLYVYYEPSRRLQVYEKKKKFEVHGSEKTIFAASMITILKLLNEGKVKSLEEAFSPDSEYIIFTRKAVSQLIKKPSPEIVALVNFNFLRITKKHGKDTLSPTEQRNYYLNPNSDEPTTSEEYEGDEFSYG